MGWQWSPSCGFFACSADSLAATGEKSPFPAGRDCFGPHARFDQDACVEVARSGA